MGMADEPVSRERRADRMRRGRARGEALSTIKGIIYDFDGVIADSEALANAVLAEFAGLRKTAGSAR